MSDRSCFVISPIGSSGTETRNRADNLFEHIIQPVVEEYGYEAKRADHIDEPGIITTQVINEVVESDLVVADLTNSNANVFYELALRHTVQKPCIQLIDAEDSIPFDLSATRVIQFNIDDIESVEGAKDEIRNQIESVDSGDTSMDNPISMAMDLKELRESTDPDERSLAEIIDEMGNIRQEIQSLREDFREESKKPEPGIRSDNIKALLSRLENTTQLCEHLEEEVESRDEITDDKIREMVRSISHDLRTIERVLYEDLEERQMKSLDNFA